MPVLIWWILWFFCFCFVFYSRHGRQGKWLCWHQKVSSPVSLWHYLLNECVQQLLQFTVDKWTHCDPTAQWRTVSCRTLPTGGSPMSSITSKQQGSRSKPQLFRIRLECSSCSKLLMSRDKKLQCPSDISLSTWQEIDGKSLLLMTRNDVLTGLSIKLGPALKIYEYHVKPLQTQHLKTNAS